MRPTDRLALSGDLVGSRLAVQRSVPLASIQSTLKRLGREYRRDFAAPPVLTRGLDEFSAVFRTPDPLFSFMVQLNESLWPDRFRIGVGVGRIDVAARSRHAGRMDGPAFHFAAEALVHARTTGLPLVIRASHADPVVVQAIESLALAHATIVDDWTPGVAKVIPTVRRSRTQDGAAKVLKVRQQAVSSAVRRGKLHVLQHLEATGMALASRLQ